MKYLTHFAVGLLLAVPAFCDNIPTIPFNTGVLNDGTLAPQGTVDLHYVDVSNIATNPVPAPVYVEARGFNYGAYQPDGPAADGNVTGKFDYQTTFTLTGYDPSTVVLKGDWAADDGSDAILINGQSVSPLTLVSCCGTSSFTISSGFQSGLNTLDFIWQNYSNPGDLGVGFTSFTGTPLPVTSSAAPEPASLGLFGMSGVALLIATRLRRKK